MGSWELYVIQLGITALSFALQNPVIRATVKPTALQIYKEIKLAFAGDPDFN